MEIPYRLDEKYWVTVPKSNDAVIVYYAVNFTESTDISLARVMMLEWPACVAKVPNAPAIMFYDKSLPSEFSEYFPKVRLDEYSNGLVSFQLTANTNMKGKDIN